MASADVSSSLEGASNAVYDNVCGPCQTNNLYKQGNHYCNECREHICNSCKEAHSKFAVLKNHTILSCKQICAHTTGSQRSDFAAYCSCNTNQEVEFYCKDHHDLICAPCKKVKHTKCKTLNVREKSADYISTKLSSVLTKTNALIHEFDRMQKQRKADRKELERLTEECRKNIKEFRARIDACLDKLEQTIFQELDEFDQEQTHRINQHISELTTGLQKLNLDKQMLEDTKHSATKIKMFTTEVRVSKSLRENEGMLAEIVNDVSELNLSFIGNKKLADFQREISSFGILKGTGQSLASCHKDESKNSKKIVFGKKATLQNQVSVKSSDDKQSPWITGSTFMSCGHAVLCDYENKNVKLLDKSLVLREHLKLSSRPWDVSVVDDNNVIITLPDTEQLQYIQVFPQLKAGRTIQLGKTCRGIEVSADEIYTTQHDISGKGEVHVLDLSGKGKRKVQTKVKFYYSGYITVSTSDKMIFVSSGYSNTAAVTCMKADGNVVYQYKHKKLIDPRGMCVDAEDNILVCDCDSHTIQMLTANGKKYGILLSSRDGINAPYSIAYREADDTLLVGCAGQDHVSNYTLR